MQIATILDIPLPKITRAHASAMLDRWMVPLPVDRRYQEFVFLELMPAFKQITELPIEKKKQLAFPHRRKDDVDGGLVEFFGDERDPVKPENTKDPKSFWMARAQNEARADALGVALDPFVRDFMRKSMSLLVWGHRVLEEIVYHIDKILSTKLLDGISWEKHPELYLEDVIRFIRYKTKRRVRKDGNVIFLPVQIPAQRHIDRVIASLHGGDIPYVACRGWTADGEEVWLDTGPGKIFGFTGEWLTRALGGQVPSRIPPRQVPAVIEIGGKKYRVGCFEHEVISRRGLKPELLRVILPEEEQREEEAERMMFVDFFKNEEAINEFHAKGEYILPLNTPQVRVSGWEDECAV